MLTVAVAIFAEDMHATREKNRMDPISKLLFIIDYHIND
jgi:hypothetical protein